MGEMETAHSRWKPIKDYENEYLISNHGEIYSLGRCIKRKSNNQFCKYESIQHKPGQLIKHNDNGNGYRFVYLHKNGNKKHVYMHRLVAEAFIENDDNKRYINHIDGDKSNNKVSNLEWVTAKENIRHAIKTGLIKRNGENSSVAELTNIDVIDIVNINNIGCFTHKEISEAYGVSRSTISMILSGKNWGTVTNGLI